MAALRKFVSGIAVLWLVWPALPAAQADTPEATTARIMAAWENWTDQTGAVNGTLTIAHKGVILHSGDGTIRDLASLSKAITAVCVLHLIDNGQLTADTRLGSIFQTPDWGLDPQGRVARITIAQLLNQSSGLRQDRTQDAMDGWYGGRQRHRDTTKTVLQSDARSTWFTRFYYSNENYSVLGSVIEVVTGLPYETVCRQGVLAPAQAHTATLSRGTGAFSSMGGWAMSTDDYTRFLWTHFGPETALGRDPLARPHFKTGGAFYGPGALVRPVGEGHKFWHFGTLCLSNGLNVGAYFGLFENGWSVVAAADICLSGSDMDSLDAAITGALHP